MKPRFKAGDRVILVGNRKLWGTPGDKISSSVYHTIPPGTPGTVDDTDATMPFVHFDGFEDRYCLRQKWLVPESPIDEDIFEVLPGCDTTPLEDDPTANSNLHPAMLVHFIKPACLSTGQWRVRVRNTASEHVVGPKWLRLVETEETAGERTGYMSDHSVAPDCSPEQFLASENSALRKAGCKLAEAALYVAREHDGVHRLMLAVAEWAKAVADEGGRNKANPTADRRAAEQEGTHE